jgi:pimeloyl-ACP methyl ester carboxylesterase
VRAEGCAGDSAAARISVLGAHVPQSDPDPVRRLSLVAPDLPGFGQSDHPEHELFPYTFATLAKVIASFVDIVGLDKYAIYIFDYGAPVGLRIALEYPDRITAIISQNGNAYLDGMGDEHWAEVRAFWDDPSRERRITSSARAGETP